MSKGYLNVQYNGSEASLIYDTKSWTLSLFTGSSTPAFQLNMNDVKKVYVSSKFKETHYEEKNKLARTIIGGALFGVTGAIIGAVSGEGDKEIVDAKYSYVHVETSETEYIFICKENGIHNSSGIFIQNFEDALFSKNDESYRKRKRIGITLGIINGIILLFWIIASIFD